MIYEVTLNGKVYEVEVERGEAVLVNEYDIGAAAPVQTSAAMGASAPASGEMIESPLPGTIFEINVSEGDVVKRGQVILVIEAMKMENEVEAPRDGTVVQIIAQRGAAVNIGDPLVILG